MQLTKKSAIKPKLFTLMTHAEELVGNLIGDEFHWIW